MSKSTFDARSKSVGELLGANSRERIVVPEFQRGYEWSKKHLQVFWSDILRFQKERANTDGPDRYFLGPIVVLNRPKQDIIDLLDGQQRLATATILLSVLRDVAKELGKDGESFARDTQSQLISKDDAYFSIELGDTDKLFFRDFIQRDIENKPRPRIRTHKNIKIARDFFFNKLKGEIDGASTSATLAVLRELKQTVRSDLVMACIPVESERDAFLIFETLNDRGLRLGPPDLLLNFLMREAAPESRKDIRAMWTQMVEVMGRRDINRFLRHLWVSKYGDLKTPDLFTALKSQIEAEGVTSLDFVRDCSEQCYTYVRLVSLDKEYLHDSDRLVKALLLDLNAQATLPLLLAAFKRFDLEDFKQICRWLLVFVTRYSVISDLDTGEMESIFYALARQVRVSDSSNPDELKNIKDNLVKHGPSDEQVELGMNYLWFEDAADAGYVLGRIADHMQSKTKEVGVRINEANLEHIFPRNPKPNEWGGTDNQETLEIDLWHIGNLTILGKRLNDAVANSEFAVKRKYYADKSELEITKDIARTYQWWDDAMIRNRARALVKYALEIWNFDNPSRV